MSTLSSGRFVARKATPVTGSRFIGTPTPTEVAPSRSRSRDETVDLGEDPLARAVRGRHLDRASDRAVARDDAREDLRPPQVDADSGVRRHQAATIPGLMATDGKPYRVYKGGRSKGRVPLQRPAASGPAGRRAGTSGGSTVTPAERRPRRTRRWIVLGLATFGVVVAVWGVLSVLAVSRGVGEANARVPGGGLGAARRGRRSPRVHPDARCSSSAPDGGVARAGAARSDSIMLVRTDPARKRVSYLSIPRDLQVSIPDYGVAKINAASQVGGPALALRTVKDVTGLPINHVVIVDFDRFKEVIDALGGIEVDVPAPIRSKRFDCPYPAGEVRDVERLEVREGASRRWTGGARWSTRASASTSSTRPRPTSTARAVSSRSSRPPWTRRPASAPRSGSRSPVDELVKPLATDLSTWELLQLGWVSFRADEGAAVHCRLGGDPATVGGESVILPSEDNVEAVAMFTGRAAPLPPPKGLPYAPGCRVGARYAVQRSIARARRRQDEDEDERRVGRARARSRRVATRAVLLVAASRPRHHRPSLPCGSHDRSPCCRSRSP